MRSVKVWIIKIGGSLAAHPSLAHWLARLATDSGRRWLLVPGGGPYADAVRAVDSHWQLPVRESHRLAIHAMGLYARQLQVLEPRLPLLTTRMGVAAAPGSAIWLPHPDLLPGLPEGWDVTADSIALWLAQRWSAEGLVLLKATPPGAGLDLEQLAAAGYVDAALPRLHAGQASLPIHWATASGGELAVPADWSTLQRLA